MDGAGTFLSACKGAQGREPKRERGGMHKEESAGAEEALKARGRGRRGIQRIRKEVVVFLFCVAFGFLSRRFSGCCVFSLLVAQARPISGRFGVFGARFAVLAFWPEICLCPPQPFSAFFSIITRDHQNRHQIFSNGLSKYSSKNPLPPPLLIFGIFFQI